MSSLIEEFNEQSNEAITPSYGGVMNTFLLDTGFETSDPVMLETGFVSTGLAEDDSRIFTLDRVQFQFPAALVAMTVSNEVLIMALETNHILRIDLQQAHDVEDIEIPKKPGEVKIYKIFLDPTGRHLLITTEQGENFYLFKKWKKAKPLSKLKSIIIESVAWNKFTGVSSDISTKKILVGSRNGLIFEIEIEPTEEYFKKEEKFCKQVYSINENMPITGLRFEQFPTNPRKYFIVATTPTRIYQFIGNANPNADFDGGSMFETLFSKYEVNPGFQELPGNLDYSELHFFTPFQDLQYQGTPKNFAWLTGPGIYHGSLVFGSQEIGDSVIDSAQLLPYPATPSETDSSALVSESPLSITLTEFHFILLYKERIRAICQLNDQIVYEEVIPLKANEVVRTMTVDTVKNTFWIYTDSSIFELIITKEDRDVWKLYLDKQMFDTALTYCKNPAQRDKVLTTQADYYFSQGRFILSAKYYAQSTVPFEEVALKFVERDERDALRDYLMNKLEKLRRVDLTQKTMIATWLVEIFLSKINLLEDKAASGAGVEESESYKTEQKLLVDDFKTFLQTYKTDLDKRTTYNLIASHGRTEELLYYATLIGDHEKVISHWIAEKDYKQALDVLSKQGSVDIFYKFAPVLMENAPYETVSVLMRQTELDPQYLIPALLKYDHSKTSDNISTNQAIRYLQYVIQQTNNVDPAIHNFLLTLYATQPTSDETDLLKFLATEGHEPHYNLDYALRLCTQNGRMQSCVHIYSNMELYEEAVDLALKHGDIELAIINADKPEDDKPLRKKLWLKIARHVVEKEGDIKTAMNYLQRCELLKIEDILPFFPDFVLIDEFKEEIITALEEYNTHINDLKADMEEATKSAESIRLDIRELRCRFATVSTDERCSLCDFPLLTRQFYVFPCQHAFHSDCLITQVTKHLKTKQLRRILDLQDQIARFIMSDNAATPGDDAVVIVPKVDQLKDELDDLVASECILCGDIMIKSIEQPFIKEEESEILASWTVADHLKFHHIKLVAFMKAKLYLTHSSFHTPNSRHEKFILDHPFNHQVELFLPGDISLHQAHSCSRKGFYYRAELPLTYFIEKSFVQEYIATGEVIALSLSEGIDITNVFALDGKGNLILHLTKDTYEELGLTGKPAKFGPKRQRYVVTIDVLADSMIPGKKGYERIKWCFEHTLSGNFPFLISYVNVADKKYREINFPSAIKTQKIFLNESLSRIENILTPDLNSIKLTTNKEEWISNAIEIYDWIGMASIKAQRIREQDSVDPYISTYRSPEPCSSQNGILVRWTGFVSGNNDSESIPLPWASLSVCGFQDSPISWRPHEHGYLMNGDNNYTFLMSPNVNDVAYILFQSLGPFDNFS
ncbi:10866_t:CDS:10 [Ambispora leptoticha]|uniref:10866_t:CDS:1 n=1 Tax=Ambispora leptoticha TaxID=144679 RepID=A0A9N8YS69_9GLOM|nr:10866_t:CDS:10 [Ambispora leptoticha]